jgi:hypothetical protein
MSKTEKNAGKDATGTDKSISNSTTTEGRNDPRPVPELSDAEREEAEKEGVKNAITRSAETNFLTRSATESPEFVGDRWPERHEIMQWAGTLDLGLDAFKAAVAADAPVSIPEGKVAGLVELERSGKNRTDYVKALCDRLGVKSPTEVTSAGPGYTNDVTQLNELVRESKQ